ncbi:VanZ family protein [Streptomyces sp. NBC_01304]|uniref:VanZ family protein n=1 Tax=Streptomyces sp. NBC_01304 TaxID=2903818 RepID=UPI002E0F4C10|nr:VanZ family protein [Streptomyces sp. NBC_01304]
MTSVKARKRRGRTSGTRWYVLKRRTPGSRGRARSRPSRSKRTRRTSQQGDPQRTNGPALPAALRVLVMLAAFAAMVGFGVVLARLTLEPSVASASLTHSNLRPGDSIRDYLAQPEFRDTIKQLGGNLLLGVPFGVLLPVLLPRTRGLLRVTLATAVVMVLVELTQGALVTGRTFDIDDVILNTFGALLGYVLLGRRLGRAVHPRRHHWWHRWTRQEIAKS